MRGNKIFVTILIFAIIVAGAINARAASISLNTSSTELYIGQTLDVNVTVDPEGAGIAGVQIDVIFDGSTLEPVAVKEGNLLGQNGANTFFSDLAPGSNSISNIVGVILENSSVTTPNVFAVITFKAKNAGTSFVELRNVKISKPGGDLLNVNVSNRTTFNIISNSNNDGNSGNSGGSSGSGGGGGGGISGENFSNIEIKEKYDRFINKDLTTSYFFKNTDPIISVNITGNINAGEINVAVEVLRNTSSLVKSPAPDTVYKNANIWVGTYGYATPTNINHAEINFRVPVSWIRSNGIDPDSITMIHYYHDAWESLPTNKISETSKWIYYEASSTRFSPHAITGKKSYSESNNFVPKTSQITESKHMVIQVSNAGNEAEIPGNPGKYLIVVVVIGIVINATLIYNMRKPKQKENFN